MAAAEAKPPRGRRSLPGLAIGAAALMPACATRVTPPAPDLLSNPAVVYIADYGRHASLLLPRPEGGYAEYAYGQWDWFAQGRNDLWRAPGVLLLPGRGALGRRDLITPGGVGALKRAFWLEHAFELTVERGLAESLLSALDARFKTPDEEPHFNHQHQLAFARDSHDYCLLHACNDEVADWLRALGCRVRGGSLVANFIVEPAEPAGAAKR